MKRALRICGAFVMTGMCFGAVAHGVEADRTFRRRGTAAASKRATEPELTVPTPAANKSPVLSPPVQPAPVAEATRAEPPREELELAAPKDAPSETPLPAGVQRVPNSLARNTLAFEIAGSGLFLSANYERRVFRQVLVRAGIGYFGYCSDGCARIVTAPLTAELLLGSRDHSLDVGGGLGVVHATDRFGGYFTGIVGYRYQPYEGGFLIRVAFTPLWLGKGMVPWGGLMAGYAF